MSSHHPTAFFSAEATRALEALAAADGVAPAALMARAGASAFATLRWRWPRARRLAVVCGRGNNGGDGYVLARLAHAAGFTVEVFADGAPRKEPARAAHAALENAGVVPQPFSPRACARADVVVDALYGSGLAQLLSDGDADMIAALNAGSAPILALDLPSGVHADTGRIARTAVRADATAAFLTLKPGLFTGNGPAYAGDILFDDLALSPTLYARVPACAQRVHATASMLPARTRTAHKGAAGTVLAVGGDAGMAGAIWLCGLGAARAGAGLVRIATHAAHAALSPYPEFIVAEARDLHRDLARADCVAVGPGLGRGRWGEAVFADAIECARPLVLDADGLNWLAHTGVANVRRDDWVLTPHPGEAARLLRCDVADIAHDRLHAAREVVARFGGVCVLKGAGSVIADAGGLSICDRGTPALATAGAGDVLTGVIAGLIAQGAAPGIAARLGVWLHAVAGEYAARGDRGLLAREIADAVPQVIARLVASEAHA